MLAEQVAAIGLDYQPDEIADNTSDCQPDDVDIGFECQPSEVAVIGLRGRRDGYRTSCGNREVANRSPSCRAFAQTSFKNTSMKRKPTQEKRI